MEDTSMDATTLQAELDKRMLDDARKPTAMKQKMIPESISVMVHYILQHFPEKFKAGSNEVPDTERTQVAMEWYK